jgi:site-specific recombinase XerD
MMNDLALIPVAAQLVARGGPSGANPAITAQNDLEAAAAFLRARSSGSSHTFEAYRKEVARLLVWLDEQRLTFAGMTVDDVHAFYDHLADPPQHWLRPRKPRHDETLRPTQLLIGPLSNKSIQYSRAVLGHLMKYLQHAGYLQRNVFLLSLRPAVVKTTAPTKFLDLESWQWFWQWLTTRPESKPFEAARAARRRWVFALLYHSGIRREEVASGVMGDFTRTDRFWTLRVLGKGNKERFVTVNSALLGELRGYRSSLDLPEYPVPTERHPLVMSIHTKRRSQRLTPRAIGALVAKTAKEAAVDCEDAHTRERLLKLSTHWMRHTNASQRLQAKASLESTQDELGHADPRTTRIYAQVHDDARREDAEKLARLAAQPRSQKKED